MPITARYIWSLSYFRIRKLLKYYKKEVVLTYTEIGV